MHQTVCLADEVSRKRDLFEKEQEGSDRSHMFSKQVRTRGGLAIWMFWRGPFQYLDKTVIYSLVWAHLNWPFNHVLRIFTLFQEFRNFSSGISDRINRLVEKKTFTVTSSSSSSSSRSPLVSAALCRHKLTFIFFQFSFYFTIRRTWWDGRHWEMISTVFLHALAWWQYFTLHWTLLVITQICVVYVVNLE